MKKIAISSVICFLVFSFVIFPAFSNEYYGRDVPDSSEIRQKLVDKWFNQDLKYLRQQESEHYENVLEQKFEVRMEEVDDDVFAIIVAPAKTIEMDLVSSSGTKTTSVNVYTD